MRADVLVAIFMFIVSTSLWLTGAKAESTKENINIVRDIERFGRCVNNKDVLDAYQKVSLETEGLLPLFRSVGDICASKFL